mmetsp:Transcript_28957/g.44721  ORF Transcript_28957/g.44721 Transcript_28957/m.44721 type:complete len:86 (-) Transcript_28957:162-419(-)
MIHAGPTKWLLFAKADTHVENSGAAASPPAAATLEKEDADAEEAVDVREARDDDAAKDMLDVNLLLTMLLLLPKERSDEVEAVIM